MTSALEHDTVTPDIETSSDAYRRRFDGEAGRFLLDAQAGAIARLMDDCGCRPDRVLDLGGGHGQIAPLLLDRGCHVTVQGSDRSCDRQIRPLVEETRDRLSFLESPLFSVPLPAGSFDLVCAVRVLSHVERWPAILEEMARLSRRWILVDYASLAGFNLLTPLLFRLKRRVEGDTRPYFCYRTAKLSGHLRSLGYTRVRVRKQLFVPMGLHRILGRAGLSRSLEGLFRATGLTGLAGSPVILLAEKPVNGEGGSR